MNLIQTIEVKEIGTESDEVDNIMINLDALARVRTRVVYDREYRELSFGGNGRVLISLEEANRILKIK